LADIRRASGSIIYPKRFERSASLLIACSAKTTGAGAEADPAGGGIAQSSGAASVSKATFSALIDGERISGGAIDDMQQENAAHTVPSGANQPTYLLFYLFDTKEGLLPSS